MYDEPKQEDDTAADAAAQSSENAEQPKADDAEQVSPADGE